MTPNPQQLALLDFIRAFIKEKRMAPTYREIAEHFKYRSLGTVYKHVNALEARGYIRQFAGKKRSIELVAREEMEPITHRQFADLVHRADEYILALRQVVYSGRQASEKKQRLV